MINEQSTADARYFNEVRPEVLAMVRGAPESVLDVGCGTGAFLLELHRRGSTRLCGIEVRPDVASIARARSCVDKVVVGDVESLGEPFDGELFDLVVVSHLLEHLVDPWTMLDHIVRWVRPSGQLIGAVPNVRNAKVVIPLLFQGRWRYVESGILDRTHLRFFTRESVVAMLAAANLDVDVVRPAVQGLKSRMLDRMSLGLLRDLAAYAICFSAFSQTPTGFDNETTT